MEFFEVPVNDNAEVYNEHTELWNTGAIFLLYNWLFLNLQDYFRKWNSPGSFQIQLVEYQITRFYGNKYSCSNSRK